ncbi:hypothetical protein DKX38_027602 [Salix brachista]|uniref:F-box domain-containing protein n=1 Tax=Salix brachista TaxID=2182728 RepID=A0A5N5J5K7_9ROSI|nr:hypothetical protein DKX38_027602 [Salix brachista]
MNTGSLNAADRISQLPDDIIHLILSFLSTPEVVRLSVLSKEWHQVYATFPLSEFYSPSFADYFDGGFRFVIFVYKSLLRQCRQYRNVPKFQFSFTKELCRPYVYSEHLPLPWDLDRLITGCIELGTHKGVKELSIYFSIPGYYKLPEAMLSVKELVVCSLGGCIFNGAAINWPSLRELSLNNVQISDQRFIDNLSLTCPLIEKFALVECSGLKYLQLSGLRKLFFFFGTRLYGLKKGKGCTKACCSGYNGPGPNRKVAFYFERKSKTLRTLAHSAWAKATRNNKEALELGLTKKENKKGLRRPNGAPPAWAQRS